MTNNNINVDEVVETIARMNADERRKICMQRRVIGLIKWHRNVNTNIKYNRKRNISSKTLRRVRIVLTFLPNMLL